MPSDKYAPDKLETQAVSAFRSPLIDLVVDDARVAWILERYPPGDMGRPRIFVVRKTDGAEEITEPIAAD